MIQIGWRYENVCFLNDRATLKMSPKKHLKNMISAAGIYLNYKKIDKKLEKENIFHIIECEKPMTL